MPEKKSPPPIGEALASARSIAKELAKATDELNQTIEEMRLALKALNLGVVARVSIEEDEHDDSGAQLVFMKYDKDWRLMVDSYDGNGDTLTFEPLTNASREMRVKAVARFPDLVHELVKSSKAEVARVQEAAVGTKALVIAVQAHGSKS